MDCNCIACNKNGGGGRYHKMRVPTSLERMKNGESDRMHRYNLLVDAYNDLPKEHQEVIDQIVDCLCTQYKKQSNQPFSQNFALEIIGALIAKGYLISED